MGAIRTVLGAALPFVLLAGCAQPPAVSPAAPAPSAAVPSTCLMPNQHRMLVAELFFGRTKAGRFNVSDAAWTKFLGDTITPNFPDGLTVFDGYGQSRNPTTGVIGRSPKVKVVLIAVDSAPDVPARLNAVIDGYRARFGQRSVGLITHEECAGF